MARTTERGRSARPVESGARLLAVVHVQAALLEAVLRDLEDQVGAADAELPGEAALVVAGAEEPLLDHLALELLHRLVELAGRARRSEEGAVSARVHRV